MGGFVFFDVAALSVVATSLWGVGPTLPLWGRVVTVDDIASVLSVGGGGGYVVGVWRGVCFDWVCIGGFVLVGLMF